MSEEKIVVVVDDSPTVRETIAFILKAKGYEVRTATNGREGVDLIRSLHPKVVMVDGMMPEMDGFEVARQVRADPELAGITIIMLTAMGQDIDRRRASDAGVDHFLTKPFDSQEAFDLLEQAFTG
ncbi:MAG: response regulator [Acidobacteria bacterium]|nr:response regulator [Acidobacteriota bacterium]